jgi:glycosyltransferase involved in cell wall biosynthesis
VSEGQSRTRISVCMATYNGTVYLDEQITSILRQLAPEDEVIVVDDCSTDGTVSMLESRQDPRISVYVNDRNCGHVFSFARAISLARHPIILLSDQDDRWVSGRALQLVEALENSNALVVTSNSNYIDGLGKPINWPVPLLRGKDSNRHIWNILGIFLGVASYYGCAMAFRKEIVNLILPMPRVASSHDLWIALASNLIGSNLHLDVVLLTRRIHGRNLTTSRRSIVRKLHIRWLHLLSLIVLASRYVLRADIRRRLWANRSSVVDERNGT